MMARATCFSRRLKSPVMATMAVVAIGSRGSAPVGVRHMSGTAEKACGDEEGEVRGSAGAQWGGKIKFDIEEIKRQMPPSATSGPILGKRFYRRVSVQPAADGGDGFFILLDQRILKTPSKNNLRVPTLRLAYAIAAEWEYQDQDGIRPFTMPLMKLTSTVIDRVPLERPKIIENLLKFFHTDALCCREDEESLLADTQSELWDPLLDWVETEFGYRPRATTSLFVDNQPKKVMDAMEAALENATDWQLAAIDFVSASAKSLIVAMAVTRGKLNIEDAMKVIRVEEDGQIQEWGLVEGGHDIDIADLRIRIASASIFLRLLS